MNYLDEDTATLPDYLRLKNLKPLASRLRGRQDDEFAEMQNPDLGGAGIDMPMPEGDINMGGFDVRANQKIDPEQQQEVDSGVYGKIGEFLGDLVKQYDDPKTPQIETGPQSMQVPHPVFPDWMYGGAPKNQAPQTPQAAPPPIPPPSQPIQQEDPTQKLTRQLYGATDQDYENFQKTKKVAPDPFLSSINQPLTPERAQNILDTMNSDILENQAPQYKENLRGIVAEGEKQKKLETGVTEGQENPTAVPGTINLIREDPILNEQFNRYIGVDLDAQAQEQLGQYEKVLAAMSDQQGKAVESLDESERMLKEKIESGKLTTTDKILMGLALIAPMILSGMMGGKEGFLGSVGGGFKGLAEGLGGIAKTEKENRQELAELSKKRTDLNKSAMDLQQLPGKLKKEIKENLPKDEKEFLKGRNLVSFEKIDPKTGEMKTYEGVEIGEDLIIKPQYINDKDDKKDAILKAKELEKAYGGTKNLHRATNNIMELAGQLNDEEISVVNKAINMMINDKNPNLTPLMGKEITYRGRKVNAALEFRQQLGLLTDSYRVMKKMKALTGTVAEHIDSLWANPTIGVTTGQDLINQMVTLQELGDDNIYSEVDSAGFYPEFVQKGLSNLNKEAQGKLDKKNAQKAKEEMLTSSGLRGSKTEKK